MRASLSLTLSSLLTVGCTSIAGDDRDDSFGGAGAKEDGEFSACQLAEVIKLVNESTSTPDALAGLGLSDDAAREIVAHRAGPDGSVGTADDDVFDDLDELDKVPFVGALALGKLVFAILPRCENDLTTRPFIDDTTFAGGGGGFARDNAEVEVVLGVQGLTGQQLRAILLSTDNSGRTVYSRIRRNRIMEAFTYNFPLDEMPWDAESQQARELMPHVALTIESDRFAVDDDGERELSVGTDLMDDTYYDTHAFSLMSTEVELRGRARWDNATTVRRLLIAAKFDTQIDADGNKVNTKVDIRTDSGEDDLPNLDTDVRRGKVAWNGSDAPVEPIRGVYEQLQSKNMLLDIGAHKGVLLLEPKAHLRSTRSRYHMNEASTNNLRAIYTNGAARIQGALNVIERARSAGIIATADQALVDEVERMATRILDKSLIVERVDAKAPNLGVTVANVRLPDEFGSVTNKEELERDRIVAETVNELYHELAVLLDDADRVITNAVDEDFDDQVDQFRAWRISLDGTLARKTAFDTFLASYRGLSTAANKANSIAAFNDFGVTQRDAGSRMFDDFEPFDTATWDRLEGYIEKAVLTVAERQLETAGLCGRMLWFDEARELWVPASSRAFSNFMIDTTDMTDMMSHEEWSSIPEAERTFAQPLPAAKVLNTVFVNELQIELGMEEDYVARLRELDAALAMDPTNATLQEQLEGARFVWGQYTGAMKVLAELKGEAVLSRLRRSGAPQDIRWGAPPDSKGRQALKIISDRD